MGETLDDFVRARIEEEVARASRRSKRRTATDGEDWVGAFTEALDKRELLEQAATADFDGRSEYADVIRRRLAASYRSHPDYRDDFSAL